jgi:hypothetical protein
MNLERESEGEEEKSSSLASHIIVNIPILLAPRSMNENEASWISFFFALLRLLHHEFIIIVP